MCCSTWSFAVYITSPAGVGAVTLTTERPVSGLICARILFCCWRLASLMISSCISLEAVWSERSRAPELDTTEGDVSEVWVLAV